MLMRFHLLITHRQPRGIGRGRGRVREVGRGSKTSEAEEPEVAISATSGCDSEGLAEARTTRTASPVTLRPRATQSKPQEDIQDAAVDDDGNDDSDWEDIDANL